MSFTSLFGAHNSGIQVGVNNGSINLNLDEELPAVDGAAFDSYDDQHEERCLSGTRIDVLCQIQEWAFSLQGGCIFWLNGMAGTGKSTIARTVAETFSKANSLGASFFFKRGEADRGSAKKLFPTIARQLIISIPQLLPYIQRAVLDNSGIIGKGLKEQFDKLLLQPLLGLKQSDVSIYTVVIVIDALDECEGDNDIRLILQLLPQLQKLDTPIRVFLTSRPELPVRLGFSEIAIQDHKDLILHEIPDKVIKHDISLFLNHRLSKIRSESFLPDDWPGEENLEKLVALSSPLFIFAATICRMFADPSWDPIDSLTEILAYRHNQSNIDRTYLPVLDRLLIGQDGERKKLLVEGFQEVVGSITILESPLSVTSLSKLLGHSERFIQLRIRLLHSVLQVPTERTLPVRLFHLSFRNFLLDPKNRDKTPFAVDKKAAHNKLTVQCLLMCQKLRKNICELPSDGTQRAEIDRQTINQHIPSELQYSCRYWVYHLVQCNNLSDVIDYALPFLQEHFLHWMEAMCLLDLASEIITTMNDLQSAISGNQYCVISDFIQDAKRFTLRNLQIADKAPLQVYSAGLIFAPKGSIVRRIFDKELPTWISQLPRVEESWSTELQTLEGHSDSVWSVAFSHDGQLLASASADRTVRLWDPATGMLQQTLEGHSDSVSSVAFSHDGQLLVSASADRTVRLWDPATGALQQTLKGYLNLIYSVAFSPDGQLLVSASGNCTVQLWDLTTGALQQTLEGYSGGIGTVTFSHDGQLLALASDDCTIQLWDLATGTLRQTLKGCSNSVYSVAFSPDGQLLASASWDGTVRLWDLATGALQQTLERHSGGFGSVAFSPDSRLLALASWDSTVRLWDLATYALQRTLKGHSDGVGSVVFSPNGQLLASASADRTVRLWDLTTDTLQQTLEGHSDRVGSVAFSQDGRLLASASEDCTIRLWDPATGVLKRTLESYSGGIDSVAFSHDTSLLALAFGDGTVRLWGLYTGILQQTLRSHSGGVRSTLSPDDSLEPSSPFGHTMGSLRPLTMDGAGSGAFWPESQLLASASRDSTIRLWNPAMTEVYSVALSPDSRLLESASGGGTMRFWNLAHTLEGKLGGVGSVAFSPDGRLLASGSDDNTVRLWDPVTGNLQQTLEGHSSSVQSVAFSPDGRLLASGSHDNTVLLWHLVTGNLQQTLNKHATVDDLEFSRDGSYVTTNLGTFVVQPCHENDASHSTYTRLPIFIEQQQWINLDRKNVLWLPPHFRPSCSAVNRNSLALGHASGRVSFLRFCI